MESRTPIRGISDFKNVEVDVASSTTMYIGTAAPGASTASAVWSIKRMVSNAEGDISIKWADGNVEEDNVWDNRASLSYS